jgi:uncharacterized protein YjiS (DUF1127 family)
MTDMTFHRFSRRRHDQFPLSHAAAAVDFIADPVYEAMAATGRSTSNAARGVAHWYRVRSTARKLNELESHMLRDIGISRSEIHSVARFVVDNPGADPRPAARRHDR